MQEAYEELHEVYIQEARYQGMCHTREFMLNYAGYRHLARQTAEEREEQYRVAHATFALTRAATYR